jgi:hypothetical protein
MTKINLRQMIREEVKNALNSKRRRQMNEFLGFGSSDKGPKPESGDRIIITTDSGDVDVELRGGRAATLYDDKSNYKISDMMRSNGGPGVKIWLDRSGVKQWKVGGKAVIGLTSTDKVFTLPIKKLAILKKGETKPEEVKSLQLTPSAFE